MTHLLAITRCGNVYRPLQVVRHKVDARRILAQNRDKRAPVRSVNVVDIHEPRQSLPDRLRMHVSVAAGIPPKILVAVPEVTLLPCLSYFSAAGDHLLLENSGDKRL